MNSERDKSEFPFRSGFLALGIAWGFFVGYVIADMSSMAAGYHWYNNPKSEYFSYTIFLFVLCPFVGLIVGMLMDARIKSELARRRILEYTWMPLLILVIFYFVFVPRT